MKRTLLLVFIHGFKGDDTTFSSFPTHLSALLTLSLPHLTIQPLLYPSFSTRGDLAATVRRFTDWLTTTVIDMEVASQTPQPTVDPGVRVVLVGHSMGGLVAAECLLALAGVGGLVDGEASAGGAVERDGVKKEAENLAAGMEKQKGTPKGEFTAGAEGEDNSSAQMFPYIQGLLSFDTPYLGISPGVVAHGAEGHWNATKAWYDGAAGLFAASGLADKLGAAQKHMNEHTEEPAPAAQQEKQKQEQGAKLPAEKAKAAASSWGKYALYTLGASTLAAAAGTTAYLARDTLTSGLTWATSHLEFIGCLARSEELKSRVAKIVALARNSDSSSPSKGRGASDDSAAKPKVGFANFYTVLGVGAGATTDTSTTADGKRSSSNEWSSSVLGASRTFCNVPKKSPSSSSSSSSASWWQYWKPARNDLAADEVAAHCDMFAPDRNSGYYGMSEEVARLVEGWVKEGGWGGSASSGAEDEGEGVEEQMEVD